MANLTNRQLWEMGVPLNSAWLEFASPQDRQRYSKFPTFAEFSERMPAAGLKEFAAHALSGSRQLLERYELEADLREHLLELLFNDELQALAFRTAPSTSRSPVRIAPDIFETNDPDWPSESLKARGLEYAEIRIVAPDRKGEVRTGRKGSAMAIRNAIAHLQNSGVDICAVNRKTACQHIRDELKAGNIKGSGLSDQNLSKYILKVCPKRRIAN